MTSEMAEDFRAWNAHKQEKRAGNRENGALLLTRASVQFESKNGGAHLIVSANGKVIDYWPGTGRWIVRGTPGRSFGVRKLLAACGQTQSEQKGNQK